MNSDALQRMMEAWSRLAGGHVAGVVDPVAVEHAQAILQSDKDRFALAQLRMQQAENDLNAALQLDPFSGPLDATPNPVRAAKLEQATQDIASSTEDMAKISDAIRADQVALGALQAGENPPAPEVPPPPPPTPSLTTTWDLQFSTGAKVVGGSILLYGLYRLFR